MASFMITVPKAVGDAWHISRMAGNREVVGELIVNDRERLLAVPIYVSESTVKWMSTMRARRADDDKWLISEGNAIVSTRDLDILTPLFTPRLMDKSCQGLKGKWVAPEGRTLAATTVRSRTLMTRADATIPSRKMPKAPAEISDELDRAIDKAIEDLFATSERLDLPLDNIISGVQKSVQCSRTRIFRNVQLLCEEYRTNWKLLDIF
jgi:hypothetical protein